MNKHMPFSALLSYPRILLVAISIVGVLGVMGAMWVKSSGLLSPGHLSAMHSNNEPLNGYVSHAEFEKDCQHCHAPLHCITDTKCQDCHLDIARQRAELNGLHSRLPGMSNCQNCHVEHQGRDAVITSFAFQNVDHRSLSGFSLALHQTDYSNQPLNCEACHTQDSFINDTLDCLTCHMDHNPIAMGEHVRLYGETCVPCHDGADRMQGFEHTNFYALDGGHADLQCQDCHAGAAYYTTARGCVDCHADPQEHIGQFGLQCERCHTTASWTEAQLTLHLFPLDHGGQGEVACETCHPGSYPQITCYGCHSDHQEAEMIPLHLELGIDDLQQCETCHPTGIPGEAEELRKGQASSLFSLP